MLFARCSVASIKYGNETLILERWNIFEVEFEVLSYELMLLARLHLLLFSRKVSKKVIE